MVEKAVTWALRMLVSWDPQSADDFLHAPEDVLVAQVRREMNNELERG